MFNLIESKMKLLANLGCQFTTINDTLHICYNSKKLAWCEVNKLPTSEILQQLKVDKEGLLPQEDLSLINLYTSKQGFLTCVCRMQDTLWPGYVIPYRKTLDTIASYITKFKPNMIHSVQILDGNISINDFAFASNLDDAEEHLLYLLCLDTKNDVTTKLYLAKYEEYLFLLLGCKKQIFDEEYGNKESMLYLINKVKTLQKQSYKIYIGFTDSINEDFYEVYDPEGGCYVKRISTTGN